MVNIIVEISKYLMIVLITMYTYHCFSIFGYYDPFDQKRILRKQNALMFMIHIVAFMVMYLQKDDMKILAFYVIQTILFAATILLYQILYPQSSRLVVNNMCMLLCIGMIILARLNYEKAVKQYLIAAGAGAGDHSEVQEALRVEKSVCSRRDRVPCHCRRGGPGVLRGEAWIHHRRDQHSAVGAGEDHLCILCGV